MIQNVEDLDIKQGNESSVVPVDSKKGGRIKKELCSGLKECMEVDGETVNGGSIDGL